MSLGGATFKAGGQVTVWMVVQGANIDVGAEVLVDDVVQPTVAWKGLRNDFLGVDPTTSPTRSITTSPCWPPQATGRRGRCSR